MAQVKLEEVKNEDKLNYQKEISNRFDRYYTDKVISHRERINLKELAESLKITNMAFYQLPKYGLSYETLKVIDNYLTALGY